MVSKTCSCESEFALSELSADYGTRFGYGSTKTDPLRGISKFGSVPARTFKSRSKVCDRSTESLWSKDGEGPGKRAGL